MHIRFRALLLVSALVVSLVVAGNTSFAQDKKGGKVDKTQQAEIAAATKLVDAVLKGQAAPSDFKFTFIHHSMRGQEGKTYVPFILTFEKGQVLPAPAIYYVRVVSEQNLSQAKKAIADYEAAILKATTEARLDPENVELAEAEERARANTPKVEYAFEDFKRISINKPDPNKALMLPRVMGLAPGTYDAYVVLMESVAGLKNKKVPAKATVMKIPLQVPNYDLPELSTSSVILSRMVQQLKGQPTPQDIDTNPYIFANMQVVPSLDLKFSKSDELMILFYVYSAGLDKTTGKPDLAIDYNFYQKADGTEKFFNKTPTLLLNATTLPPTFDTKAGHQLNGGQGLPLASFPEGEYRLEIKIVDKTSGKTKTQNCSFTVAAG